MSITDELRTSGIYLPASNRRYFTEKELTAIADRIDAEHESACGEAYGNGVQSVALPDMTAYVKLPKDADGEYIRIGDELDYLEALHPDVPARFKVQDMFYFGNGKWHLRAYPATYEPEKCRHYHAPTVEDVLREFAGTLASADNNWGSDVDDAIAKYAAKLSLAEGEDA